MLKQSQAGFSFIQEEKINCPDSGFGQYETHLLTSSGRGSDAPGKSTGWFAAVGGSVYRRK